MSNRWFHSIYISYEKKNPSMLPCSLTLKEKGLKSSAKWYEVNIVLSFLLSDKWKFTQHNI